MRALLVGFDSIICKSAKLWQGNANSTVYTCSRIDYICSHRAN